MQGTEGWGESWMNKGSREEQSLKTHGDQQAVSLDRAQDGNTLQAI